MSSSIPQFFDIWHFSDAQKHISGRIDLSKMARLSSHLKETDSSVDFELNFSRNWKKQVIIRGFIKTVLKPECQRCLKSVAVELDIVIDLIALNGIKEVDDVDDSDALYIIDPVIELSQMLEDELILALPHISLHEENECTLAYVNDFEPMQDDDQPNSDNPFKVLSTLKSS